MVTGNVAIAGDPYITTLGGLAGVTTIGGTLLVQGDDELADLDERRRRRAPGRSST